ncbi:DUF1731 domain-containing protein [Sinomonas mesophila]|uniref:DUF1731 domain-containing protein n=1 Tax=Sinomonas mesophila TaxID=1531955 RepID=UPI0009867248|nr:DUF1731 domain-containing protein [Sinomonas mesophila]
MTWQRSASQWFRLPADRLWAVLSRLERWPEWNPAIGAASLDGVLREGAQGSYSPAHRLVGPLHRRTAPPFTVTGVESGRRLAFRQGQPGGGQNVEWTLEEGDGGTVFTQRVALEGPLAQPFGLTAGEPLVRRFEAQCARLYRLAASPSSPGGSATDDGDGRGRLFAIAGGSGLLGTLLASDLVRDGHRVAVLTRSPSASPFEQIAWDGRSQGAWAERLGSEPRLSVVNLAGTSMDRPGTEENLAMLTASRVEPTRALVEASRRWERPAERWLQQSGTGIYGATDGPADESAPLPVVPGLPAVARDWEASVDGSNAAHLNVVRSGVVLHRDAPLMARLTVPARLGAGGHQGTGGQYMSWIHATDWVRAARAVLGLSPAAGERPVDVPAGVVNATAPFPVQNSELMARLRDLVGVPVGIPAPEPLLRVAAAVLRTNPDLVLEDIRAVPAVLQAAGFTFAYPRLGDALAELGS